MRVGVLGPLEVTGEDRTPRSVQGAKERLLLGILAAEANRTVGVDRLVELLWNGAPPATAVKTLQSHVVRLRSALEPDRPRGSSGRYVVRRGPGYALAVARHEVDAVRFTDAVARGRARLVSGESASARDEIAAALTLWRGEPYSDWPDAEFAEAERRRLAEVRVTAQEGLIDADLALGRHVEAVPELESFATDDPLHEGWWARLMLALYRAGRQGDALAAAQRARAILADELGVDPGPELTRLEAAILAQDPSLDASPIPPTSIRQRVLTPAACPYKGLAAYQPEDAPIFHGRSRLVRALVAALVDSRLLVVSGPSGAGKSSVVHAGLIPALAAGALPGSDRWDPVVVVPGTNPVDTLVSVSDPAAPAILVVDQGEELWTSGAEPAERRAFLDTLLGLLDDGTAIRLIVVLRGDHLGRLAEHGGFAEQAAGNMVLVPPLSELELREVVQAPAEIAGLRVEPELVDAIVGDVVGQPGALPLVSTALVGTWERRRDNVLTLAGYLQAGGVDGALARSAETTYTSIDADAQQRVRPMLVRLAGQGEQGAPVRRRVGRDELGLDGPDGEARSRAIAAFVDKRLLAADENTFEVAHEALLSAWPRLAGWLADDAAGRAIRGHLVPAAKEWDERGRPSDELYRGSRLAAALEWRATSDPDLTSVERDFLDESEALAEAELRAAHERAAREAAGRRRTRRLAAALGIALVGSVAAGAIALQQGADAQREAQIAFARELAAAAVANLDADPERSILLALQAVDTTRETDGTVLREAEEALRAGLRHSQVIYAVPHGGPALAVSPDGRRFATGGIADTDNAIVVRDIETGEPLLTLTGPNVGRPAVGFSPDGQLIATTHNDGTVRLWDGISGAEQQVLHGHRGWVGYPVFSPDGTRLATGGEDATLRIWDVATGTPEMVFTGHEDETVTPSFSADGTRVAIDDGPAVRIWDLTTGESAVVTSHFWSVPYADMSSDGSRVATTNAGMVSVWDIESGALLLRFDNPGAQTAVTFSPDGTRVAAGGGEGVTRVWNAQTGQQLATLAGHDDEILNLAFTPDGERLLTSSRDGSTRLWDISVGGSRDWLTVPGVKAIWSAVRFSPDGRWFAAPAEPSGVTIWDTRTGDAVVTLSGYDDKLTVVAFSPDGSRLAAGSDVARTPPVWDTRTGELLFTLTGHSAPVRAVAFSPDGTRIATGGWDRTLRMWDAATGDQQAIRNVAHELASVAFSPDGRFILTGNEIGNVDVWDATSMERVRSLRGHEDLVEVITYGPDEMLISAGGSTARVWDFQSGKELLTLRGHRGGVYAAALSPDGTLVATGGHDSTAKLWDAATGRELLTLHGHDAVVFGVDFSPDGRLLATASPGGTVALHLLPVGELVELARERLTRDLSDDECRQYLRLDRCA